MKTDELIVQLTRSLEPVEPLASPGVRLIRWIAVSLPVAALGVLVVGARADVLSAARQPLFAALAIMALATAIMSAASALLSGVPGSERTPAVRLLPVAAASVWTATLAAMLIGGGAPLARLLAWPVHTACIIEIAIFAVVPGWALFDMVRRAAPLHATWSALLAGLAATALGAAATQIVCPIDDPAHHLVGHIAPMVVLTIVIAASRRRSLIWAPARVP